MVEFRRDIHGSPVLMEVNPRMGGSVGLAVAAGVDFPSLLLDWKLGATLPDISSYEVGRRMRWLPGDIWNLKCVYDSQGHPDVPGRARATATFLLDFLRPANTIDVVDRHDLRPAWSEMNRIVFAHASRRIRRRSRAMEGV
jgi:hypothetical protein